MITLETERLLLNRRVTELSSRTGDAGVAAEMRRLWLRRQAIGAELRELRDLLHELSPRRERQLA
jgi:hypothetical protein